MAFQRTVRRIQLGNEFRRIREERGLLPEDVAKALPNWSVYKISRAENAKGAVKVEHAAELLDFLGVDDGQRAGLLDIAKNAPKQGWWLPYTGVVDEQTVDLASLESEASVIKTYQPFFIPGLFQTPDYARAIFTELGGFSDEEAQRRVDVRMARQAVLTRPRPPEIWAVIHEAALSVKGGGPDVMRAQMDRLIQVARFPNVNIQIMPSGCALNPAMNGALTILGFPYDPPLDVALVVAQQTEVWIEERRAVAEFHGTFQKITAEALPLDNSLAFITEKRDKIK
ncbi:helix-turn-helix domain-containing protein [Kitasatospora sp. NPDC093550]|uniref:helix-turn-helix domain-containing protein n=1 Tax=Kitasatospora sp. NPDC093550 TaxID=3364089 RepID=UPI0038053E9B